MFKVLDQGVRKPILTYHNLPYILNLPLRLRNRILPPLRRSSILHQHLPQPSIKRRAPIRRQCLKVRPLRIILREEPLLHLHQISKRHPLSDARPADNEECEVCGCELGVVFGTERDVVDEVCLVREGELAGLVVLYFGKDDGGEVCDGGRGSGGVFG